MSKKTAKKKAPAKSRKRNKKQPQVVKYRDTKGNEWEVEEGKPSGCFTLPGENGQLYSIRDFLDFVKKNVAKVKIANAPGQIESAGDVDFEAAMLLTGEPLPPKGRGSKKKAVKKSSRRPTKKASITRSTEELSPLVANYLTVKKILSLKRNKSGLTKAMLAKQTSLSVHQISRAMGHDRDTFTVERRGRDTYYTL